MTTFHVLYQGEVLDPDNEATAVAIFSTPEKASDFEKLLSDEHTELKRAANEARTRRGAAVVEVPDLYWDIRPLPFDPRTTSEV